MAAKNVSMIAYNYGKNGMKEYNTWNDLKDCLMNRKWNGFEVERGNNHRLGITLF